MRCFDDAAYTAHRLDEVGLKIEATDFDPSGSRSNQSDEHTNRRRLPGAVGPKKSEHFTRLHIKSQAMDHLFSLDRFRYISDGHRHHDVHLVKVYAEAGHDRLNFIGTGRYAIVWVFGGFCMMDATGMRDS